MNLFKYQKNAITTKIYDDSVAIPYVVLGLVGEVGELFEKLATYQGGSLDLIEKEIGDVMWYCAAWAEETGSNLQEIYNNNDFNLFEFYLENTIFKASAVAELTKKALRDDFESIQAGIFPKEKRLLVDAAVADIVKSVEAICDELDIDFEDMLLENLEKLRERAQKGKISGSGDLR